MNVQKCFRLLITGTVAVISLLYPFTVHADRTYTPEELTRLVKKGDYPPQGEVTTQTRDLAFDLCITTVHEMTAAIEDRYPVVTITDNSLLLMKKLWTNDAAMTLSCSSLDKRLIITTAPYK